MDNRPSYVSGYKHWVCPVWRIVYECAKWIGIAQIQNSVRDCHLVPFHDAVGKEEDQVVRRLFAVALIKQLFLNEDSGHFLMKHVVIA